MTRLLPGCCHDALNRLLRTTPWSTRKLLAPLVAWIRRSGACGYLCLDDAVVEKAFAKRLRWAGWTYSFAKQRKVYGMHVVVLLWCATDRRFRIPVAVCLWRPKRSCTPHRYQTKLQLAAGMRTELVAARLPFAYLVADTPLHRRLVHPLGRAAGDLLGRDPAPEDHGHLAGSAVAGR